MPVNGNNFLRWEGSSTKRAFTLTPSNPSFTLFANVDSATVAIFTGASASLGIDMKSFEINLISDSFGNPISLQRDCEYDGAGNLTISRPVDLSLTIFFITFTWADYSGNISHGVFSGVGASINSAGIVVSAIVTEWVVYPVSQICLLDSFGNNTGYSNFTQLKLQNALTHVDISPLQLKPNEVWDGDYIAPVTDYITCPTPSLPYGTLYIFNNSKNGANPANYITITNIYISSGTLGIGGGPIALNIPCNIPPGFTKRLFIPSGAWTPGITISYVVTGDMISAFGAGFGRYWRSNAAGFVDNFPTGGTHLVDNSGIYGATNILIPTASSGIIIFAQ